MKYSLVIIIILFGGLTLMAQEEGEEENHLHLKNEVALVPGLVYDFSGRHLALSAHGHWLRKTEFINERFSFGIDAEFVGGTESHFATGPVFAIKPALNLIILYSPGITFKKIDGIRERYFSSHMEVAAEFEVGSNLHLGPSAGLNIASGDRHVSLGMHVGMAF